MNTSKCLAFTICAILTLTIGLQTRVALGQQVPLPKTPEEISGPVHGTTMTGEYVRMVGRLAYLWAWPMVNMHNRRASIIKAPEPGLVGGCMPVAPQGQISMLSDYIDPQQKAVACPNQDVVYGIGFFALDSEPAIIQVPDFGDRFWVYGLYDGRTDAFAQLGKLYGTKPGFYLLVGPHWKGEVPARVAGVIRSSTDLAAAIPRIFMDDTAQDREAIQSVINQIVAYPLSRLDGTMKTKDWRKAPRFPAPKSQGQTETQWVVPEQFFDQLPAVMSSVSPLPGEEALYAWIKSVIEAGEKNPEIKAKLREAAIEADKELIKPLFSWKFNGKPTGNGWNSPTNNAEWGTDYLSRTAVAKSNILENTPKETKYFFTDCDEHGKELDGRKLYAITFAKGHLPAVHGFWSLTLYNENHFFHPNQLKRYSLGTKNKSLSYNPDGSLTLYAGANNPGKDKTANWLPAPDGKFSLYIRAYWPKEEVVTGTWKPPAVKVVE